MRKTFAGLENCFIGMFDLVLVLSIPLQLQTSPEYGQGMNPISRLAQIQQAKKEKEPEYNMLTERGLPRRREFVMQVRQEALGLAHSLPLPALDQINPMLSA